MQIEKNTYQSLQVEFAPGLYMGMIIASSFAYIANNYIYTVMCWALIVFYYYKNKPLRYLFSVYKSSFTIFTTLIITSILLPITISLLFSTAMSEFIMMLSIPIGPILVFLFLINFYTHEKLSSQGWVNISGKYN